MKVAKSDKMILAKFGVVGKYASWQDVPDYVKSSELDKAKSRARIRINTLFMVLVAVSAILIIKDAKARSAAGESIVEANMEKKRQYLAELRAVKKEADN